MKTTDSIHKTEEFRKYFRSQVIPSYYSGLLHLLFSGTVLIGGSIFCLKHLNNVSNSEWLLVPIMILVGNLAIYCIHKYPLHRRIPLMKFAYKIHTLDHHSFFTEDNLVYDSMRDFYILLFPPFVVIFVGFFVGPLFGFIVAKLWSTNAGLLVCFGHYIYFVLYEIFHYVSHLPKDHFVMKFYPFAYMREHHKRHHTMSLMSHYNFNVVFPLCDKIFGSFYTQNKAAKISRINSYEKNA